MNGNEIIGLVLLGLAAPLLAVAVWRRREGGLLAAVIAYAGMTIYIVDAQPRLLAVALTLPIALAVMGLARFVSERAA